ncbi:Translin [Elaphomyces granulatus]
MATTTTNVDSNSRSSAIQTIFRTFCSDLDDHHDRRERVVKASRDITALSKKILRMVNVPVPPSIAKENQSRFDQITALFQSIVPDISGLNAWRYQRQITWGIQEFIEALSFLHYIQTQTLISPAEVAAQLPPGVMVTEEDYLMGILDLTGEMMRFAVTVLSTGGQIEKPNSNSTTTAATYTTNTINIDSTSESPKSPPRPQLQATQGQLVIDLRGMRANVELLKVPRQHGSYMMRELHKKVEVMQSSVEKVERAAYGILVRGSERPTGWTPDLSSAAAITEVESY